MDCNMLGLSFEKTTPNGLKAFAVFCRDAYMAAHFDGEVHYAATPGKALGSWMRQHHEHDYLEIKRLVRMRRHPEADFIVAKTDQTAEGQLISDIYGSMTSAEKISILQFGGINLRHVVSDLAYHDTKRARRVHDLFHLSLRSSSGHTSAPAQQWLFNSATTTLIEEIPLTHFPGWCVQRLNPLGFSVLTLVIQELLASSGELLTLNTIKRLEWVSDNKDHFQQNAESSTPRFFHKTFLDNGLGELASQPCYIYSHEHGLYWLDTSGYSRYREKCRIFTLSEALDLVSHCGDEKGIYIQFFCHPV